MDGDRRHLDGEQASQLCDENTIGVVAVLGSTFDGSYEPVEGISAALDAFQRERGLDLPLHVDAASGGFVAPFLQPDLRWDFRLPRVQSINASGHKYGLVYPGIGWALWRDAAALPEDLVSRVNYLGGDMPTFALNFSRPGSQVVAQYYNFVRLGRAGYRAVQQRSQDIARRLADGIADIGPFELLTDGGDLRSSRSSSATRSRTTPSSRSRARCGSGAGRFPRTRCPPISSTSPSCASSCASASTPTWRTSYSTT
jgi:glutamate decarboxylase